MVILYLSLLSELSTLFSLTRKRTSENSWHLESTSTYHQAKAHMHKTHMYMHTHGPSVLATQTN